MNSNSRDASLVVDPPTRINIVQVISSVSSEAAGTTYCVSRLSKALANDRASVEVLALRGETAPHFGAARARYFSVDHDRVPVLGSLLFSHALKRYLAEAVAVPFSIMHSNGLWRMPNVYPGEVARQAGVPLVVSPHGMLGAGALQFSRTKKRLFWWLAQRRALDDAACLHVTSAKEYEDVRMFGLKAPVAVIPNGIDVPSNLPPKSFGARNRSVLYVGRVHPKKGLDSLLLAWSRIEAEHPDWNLRIVGPSEGGHGAHLAGLAQRLGLRQVVFCPGLFGEAKAVAYREADLFVLPTLDENFGMVVAEALSQGTPVICSKGAPWAGLGVHGCGWWVDHGAEALSVALRTAMAMPRSALEEMGEKGRGWMLREFSWERIAAEMYDVYLWCLGRGERPPMVSIR